jgi:hypothetical protein
MINLEEFRQACGTFDSVKCYFMLNSVPATEADSRAVILEEHVRQTGCLIQPRLKQGNELNRANFLEFCRAEIAKSGEHALSARFEEHVKDSALLERGYRAILDTLKGSPGGQLPPGAQVWAAIGRAVREIVVLHDQMKRAASVQEELFDPVGAKVKREGAPDIAPDFVVNTVVNVLGSTIMMLAYENDWLDNKRLVLPGPVTIDEPTLLQAGITAYLGAMWRALKQSDDRLRYFGGELRLSPVNAVDEDNIAHKIEALLFQHELGAERVDIIANERLMRVQFGFAMELELETNAAEKISKAESGVPLSPDGYVSFDEMLSFLTLGDLFCYPVESDQPIYKGLALKQWLRGYALIKEKLAHQDGVPILELRTFSTPELISMFTKFGLSNEQTLAFLDATTFSKGRNDLFDTPFLRGQGESWHLFSPAYMAANISNILVSMLSTNGVQFETKGKRFEAKINALLNKHGLNAKTFKYTVGDDQFECDAAFVWDDRLFLLECKNYGLSGLNVISSYHFLQKMQEASDQVARICSQLNADPSIVKRHLGANVSWSATVPCVLNAMPWAAGKLGDTYFYDSSALTKFFDEGFLAIVMPIKVDSQVTIQRRHKFALWSGEKPTAQDLLRQLEKPLQIQVLEDEWEIDAPLVLLSKELGLISPFLKRRQPDPRRSLKSYGLGDEDITKLLDNFEETRNMALKLKAAQPQSARKT